MMNDDLTVYYDGTPVVVLNKNLLDSQGAWPSLGVIKEKHLERMCLSIEMYQETDPDLLKLYDALYTLIEFELQELWGFPQDINYHKFWLRPRCSCPKLDSEDAYPYGHYYISGECVLHGG